MAEQWLIIFWLFAVGAAVGSFLNVVVYRLPLGISLIYPPSHCPKCGKYIPWYDNVPIVGWIILRGRCRQCRNPISMRYPLIEAITAAMFGVLAVVEINRLATIYPYHVLLLCTLLCAALIEFDGNRPPLRLFVPAFLVGGIAPLFLPQLRFLTGWAGLSPMVTGIVDGLAGLALGALLGGIVWLVRGKQRPIGLLLSLISIGIFLGWQALGWIAACTGVLELAMWAPYPVSRRLHVPATVSLTIFTLFWLCFVARFALSL